MRAATRKKLPKTASRAGSKSEPKTLARDSTKTATATAKMADAMARRMELLPRWVQIAGAVLRRHRMPILSENRAKLRKQRDGNRIALSEKRGGAEAHRNGVEALGPSAGGRATSEHVRVVQTSPCRAALPVLVIGRLDWHKPCSETARRLVGTEGGSDGQPFRIRYSSELDCNRARGRCGLLARARGRSPRSAWSAGIPLEQGGHRRGLRLEGARSVAHGAGPARREDHPSTGGRFPGRGAAA